MNYRKPQLAILVTIITLCAFCVVAQQPLGTPPPLIIEDNEVLNIESRLVIVPVSVTDLTGQPVKGLGAEHFSILENSKSQEIVEVADAEKIPLEIALLFDISGTTNPMFRFEQDTAVKFLQEVMRPEDRATIFTIGEAPVLLQSRNVAYRSIEAIRTIKPTKQYTAFYDTVMAAAQYLQRNASPKSRKVVIAITDGEDTNSKGVKQGFAEVYAEIGERLNSITTKQYRALLVEKRREIRLREQNRTLKQLQDADTVFYSVNPAGSSYKLNKMSQFGQSNMQRFADDTGGTAFLPKFLPIDLKSNYERNSNIKQNTETLNQIFSRLKNELQAQYLVQYYSNNEFPANKYVTVKTGVKLNLPQGINIRARKGYFVKGQ